VNPSLQIHFPVVISHFPLVQNNQLFIELHPVGQTTSAHVGPVNLPKQAHYPFAQTPLLLQSSLQVFIEQS